MIPLHRLWSVCMLSLVIFGLVVTRLGYLQIYCHASLSEKAAKERVHHAIEIPRGAIFDRSGHVLAMTITGGSCFADPKRIKNPAMVARALAPVLNLPANTLEAKLRQRRRFVWLGRRLDPERTQSLRDLALPGITVVTESKRFYPEEALASQVLGIVGADHDGASGVEQAANGWLSGRSTPFLFASWNLSNAQAALARGGELTPRSIVLTLDRTLQYIVEQELSTQMQTSRARSGTIIVEDPQTGEILAMATAPTFNPNLWGAHHGDTGYSLELLKNSAVEKVVEPGSTFKLVTAAAALDQHIVDLHDTFFCENGSWQIRGRTIHDHEKDGWLTFTDVISHSSNIGTAKVAQRVGSDTLFRYARAFGFGMPTGCGLPGEGDGILRNPRSWNPASLATIAFGQEVGVTPLQMVNAYSVVANGGLLLEPRMYKGIVDEDGIYREWKPRVPVRRVISSKTVAELRQILKEVVDHGTGKEAHVDGYSIAGKTGTAQIIDPQTHQYYSDRYLASFCGIAPVESPRLVIGVFLEDPRGSYYGGSEAAPVFARIVRDAVKYLHIEPRDIGPVAFAHTLDHF
jgi:cell division protein FtsI (penicillin-binding protein 3)